MNYRDIFSQPFNQEIAEQFLMIISTGATLEADTIDKVTGSDKFNYISLVIENVQNSSPVVINATSFLSQLLQDGCGLMLLRDRDLSNPPVWVYKYADLLCFHIFKRLSPPPSLDPSKHQSTLNVSVEGKQQVRLSYPSDQIFPISARETLNKELGKLLQEEIELDPQLLEFPQLDKLIRFKLNIPQTAQRHPDLLKQIGLIARWVLPYEVYL